MAYRKNQQIQKYTRYGEEITVSDIEKYPILAIEERGINKRTAEHFGIRTQLGNDGITPTAYCFPYYIEDKLVGYKIKDLTKVKQQDFHFTSIGYQGVKCEMFGTQAGNKTGGKRIWITEGELDAAICWQVLKAKYPQGNPTVVSISSGTANAVENIGQKKNIAYIKKFSECILAFDNDEATPQEAKKGVRRGKEATALVYGLLPAILVANFPEDQDPCDMYKKEGQEQLYWALMKPSPYTPEGFVSYTEIREEAIELPVLGKPWPWPSFTKLTLGRRIGEGYYFGSGVKMGKSVLVDTLAEHVTSTEFNYLGDPQKIALFKFEERPAETTKKVAGKFFKKDFTNPEKVIFIDKNGREVDVYGNPLPDNRTGYYSQEELITAVDEVGPKLCLYNNYGKCNWDELQGAIRHAVLVEHIEDIVIDPITKLTTGLTPAEANAELERFSDEISKMAMDLGFTYYCFCHLKAPDKGKPHEYGGKVYSSQFTGSRAMMRSCYYMIGMEGNKDPSLPLKKRNTRRLVVLDDRKYGRTGVVDLFYDWKTSELQEPPKGFLDSESEEIEEFLQQSNEIDNIDNF